MCVCVLCVCCVCICFVYAWVCVHMNVCACNMYGFIYRRMWVYTIRHLCRVEELLLRVQGSVVKGSRIRMGHVQNMDEA